MKGKLPIPLTAFALTFVATLLWLTEPEQGDPHRSPGQTAKQSPHGESYCGRVVQGSTNGARLRAAIANCLKTAEGEGPYAITLDAAVTSRGYHLRALEHADIFLAPEIRRKCIDGVLANARPELRVGAKGEDKESFYEIVEVQLARLTGGSLRSSQRAGCSNAPLSLPRVSPTDPIQDGSQLFGRPAPDDATTQALARCETQLRSEERAQSSFYELRLGGPRNGTPAERCSWGDTGPYGACVCKGLITWMDSGPVPTASKAENATKAPIFSEVRRSTEGGKVMLSVEGVATDPFAKPRRFWFGRTAPAEQAHFFGVWPLPVTY